MLTRQARRVIAEFTRARLLPEGWVLEYRQLKWPHPSEPRTRWRVVGKLPASATAQEVLQARMALADQRELFPVCTRCHELNPTGWMHDRRICQGCAADDGVVN